MSSWEDKIFKLKEAVKQTQPVVKEAGACIHGDLNCIRCAGDNLDNQQTTYWEELEELDLKRVILSLPDEVVTMLKRFPKQIVLAGGYIRSIIANEQFRDIDLFVQSKENALTIVLAFTPAYTEKKQLLQCIFLDSGVLVTTQTSWDFPFTEPHHILEQFDYTVVKAAIWFENGDGKSTEGFRSICHKRFYRDLASKALVLDTSRTEGIAAIPRLIKYSLYGYKADPSCLAEVITRTCLSLDLEHGFEGIKNQLESYFKIAGNSKSWSDVNAKYVERTYEYSSGS